MAKKNTSTPKMTTKKMHSPRMTRRSVGTTDAIIASRPGGTRSAHSVLGPATARMFANPDVMRPKGVMPRRNSSSPKTSIANEMRTRRNAAASIDASSRSIVDALEPPPEDRRRAESSTARRTLLSTAATSAMAQSHTERWIVKPRTASARNSGESGG